MPFPRPPSSSSSSSSSPSSTSKPPRLSLWLSPPLSTREEINLHRKLKHLTADVLPSLPCFESPLPRFEPHITLLTGIYLPSISGEYDDDDDDDDDDDQDEGKSEEEGGVERGRNVLVVDPQRWLDDLDLETYIHHPAAANVPKVFLGSIKTGTTFTKKCYIQVDRRDAGLRSLAKGVKRAAANANACVGSEENRGGEGLDGEEEKAEQWVGGEWDPHLSLIYYGGDVTPEILDAITEAVHEQDILGREGTGDQPCWEGGRIQLVDTSVKIEHWKVIAEREVPAQLTT